MRFKKSVEYEHGLKQLDIAPLINIIFLLAVFVLLITGFTGLPGFKVNAPGPGRSLILKQRSVEISVDGGGQISYNGSPVSPQQLKGLLSQFAPAGISVLVKADKAAPLSSFSGIWQICRDLGISQINVATSER